MYPERKQAGHEAISGFLFVRMDDLPYEEHFIPVTVTSRIYARDYGGYGPALFLLHGFPDNMHLYDYLVPELCRHFRVILFDFLGWGRSDKPAAYPYSARKQQEELASVLRYFNFPNCWLLAHDASGPPAINYYLDHPKKIQRLVLLNTYYSAMPTLRAPEAIWMFSRPLVKEVAGFFARHIKFLNRVIYYRQVGTFIRRADRRRVLVPKLFETFSGKDNFNAFLRLNAGLLETIAANSLRKEECEKAGQKVIIAFGGRDPYLNPGVADSFSELFEGARKYILPGAGHYVQVDKPEKLAEILIGEL